MAKHHSNRRSISLKGGLALLLLWGPLSPLTMLWVLGEHIQKRTPSWWRDKDGFVTGPGIGLLFSALLVPFLLLVVIARVR